MYLETQPQTFVTERARVAFVISLLSGRALQWATPLWNNNANAVSSLSSFISQFRQVFGHTTSPLSVHDQLFTIRQGKQTVSSYALHFRTLAAASGWGEKALTTAYRRGLNPDILTVLRGSWSRVGSLPDSTATSCGK
ncbi:MAG: DUF4939 domain-containing protein [Aeromonas sp.]